MYRTSPMNDFEGGSLMVYHFPLVLLFYSQGG